MPVFPITIAAGREFTVIVKELEFMHPFELVSVNVYEVVDVGLTIGFAEEELNPAGALAQE